MTRSADLQLGLSPPYECIADASLIYADDVAPSRESDPEPVQDRAPALPAGPGRRGEVLAPGVTPYVKIREHPSAPWVVRVAGQYAGLVSC